MKCAAPNTFFWTGVFANSVLDLLIFANCHARLASARKPKSSYSVDLRKTLRKTCVFSGYLRKTLRKTCVFFGFLWKTSYSRKTINYSFFFSLLLRVFHKNAFKTASSLCVFRKNTDKISVFLRCEDFSMGAKLTNHLQTLTQMHKTGELDDDEYRAAKRCALGLV